jgi:hypothetical protein
VSSMPLKGAMRGKQALKTWCLAEECHGESPEACIALRVRREALWRNVFITRGYTGTP